MSMHSHCSLSLGNENTYTTMIDESKPPLLHIGFPACDSLSSIEVAASDVDPDCMNSSLRDLSQQLTSLKKERVNKVLLFKQNFANNHYIIQLEGVYSDKS